jgi:hypothetical protein
MKLFVFLKEWRLVDVSTIRHSREGERMERDYELDAGRGKRPGAKGK